MHTMNLQTMSSIADAQYDQTGVLHLISSGSDSEANAGCATTALARTNRSASAGGVTIPLLRARGASP